MRAKTDNFKIFGERELLPNFIELETSTFCNRRCPWCPNSIYSRSMKQKNISNKLFNKIINELAELRYSGEISLHNYNEPLLDKKIFYYINKIKMKISKSHILLYSNGDYLNRKMVNKIAYSGVKTLFISIHDAIENRNYKEIIESFDKRMHFKKNYTNVSDKLGEKFLTHYKRLNIIYYMPYVAALTSRGGILKKYNKKNCLNTFCYLPFSSCAIDFEGNFKICCEVYPANKIHKKYGIIGNLSTKTFLQLWFSRSYNSFRKDILHHSNNNVICSDCRGYTININRNRLEKWKNFLNK